MTVPRFPCSKRLFSFVNPSSLPLVLLSFPFYPSFFPSSRRLFLSSRPSSPSSFLCVLPSYLCVPFLLCRSSPPFSPWPHLFSPSSLRSFPSPRRLFLSSHPSSPSLHFSFPFF